MKNQKFIITVITVVILALFSGIVGAIVSWTYFVKDAYNMPLFGNIDFASQGNGSNLVIRDAKNVVVEQNVKVDEVARSAQDGLVGFYKKLATTTEPSKDNAGSGKPAKEKPSSAKPVPDSYLDIDSYQGEGFVITSDGWIITDYLPEEISKLLSAPKATSTTPALSAALSEYIIVGKNRAAYVPLEVVSDKHSGYSYWKIKANDLPVKKFIPLKEIKNGELALAVNMRGWTWLSSVSGISEQAGMVKSSDEFKPELALTGKTSPDFHSSFLFDLNGDLLGVIDSKGTAKPISNFLNCIDCLLAKRAIDRPSLGVRYIDLSNAIKEGETRSQTGFLIYNDGKNPAIAANSPAARAGLAAGDIITSVNDQAIMPGDKLGFIISQYAPGQRVTIGYTRGTEKKQLDLSLGKL